MLKQIVSILILVSLMQNGAAAQVRDRSNGCMIDSLKSGEEVFTRMEIVPKFKGNMKWFLTNTISLDPFLHSMQPKDTVFSDTARFTFVVSKDRDITNVVITKARTEVFRSEALRLFRLSSCGWEPGESGGRRLNGWAQFEIYFRLTRRFGEIRMNIDYRQIDPAELKR